MTNWQASQWMRAGGDLDRAKEFAQLVRLEHKTLSALVAVGIVAVRP